MTIVVSIYWVDIFKCLNCSCLVINWLQWCDLKHLSLVLILWLIFNYVLFAINHSTIQNPKTTIQLSQNIFKTMSFGGSTSAAVMNFRFLVFFSLVATGLSISLAGRRPSEGRRWLVQTLNDRGRGALKDESCCICLESFGASTSQQLISENDQICRLGCGHCFHSKCIQEWLSENETCPMCRSEVIGWFNVPNGKPSPNGRTFTVANRQPAVPGYIRRPHVRRGQPEKPTSVTLKEQSGAWATYELVSMHYAKRGHVVKWQNNIVTIEKNGQQARQCDCISAEKFIHDIDGAVDILFRTKSELSRSESVQCTLM